MARGKYASRASWRVHDLDQGYRDALALLTAIDADDNETRQLIARNACASCLIEALLAMLFTVIGERGNGGIQQFALETKMALDL